MWFSKELFVHTLINGSEYDSKDAEVLFEGLFDQFDAWAGELERVNKASLEKEDLLGRTRNYNGERQVKMYLSGF